MEITSQYYSFTTIQLINSMESIRLGTNVVIMSTYEYAVIQKMTHFKQVIHCYKEKLDSVLITQIKYKKQTTINFTHLISVRIDYSDTSQ